MGTDKRIGIGLVMLVLLGFRYWQWNKSISRFGEGDVVRLEAVVRDDPLERIARIYIDVDVNKNLTIGDKIILIGTLEKRVIKNDAQGLWLNYHSSQKIERYSLWDRYMGIIRQSVIANLQRWLPADEGALGAGILVGGTEGMSKFMRDAFRKAGLSHVMAASGYNVAVVAGWVGIVGRKLGKRKMIPFVLLSVVVYMFLAGMSAAVVRAGVMAILSMVGLWWGRKADGYWLLVIGSWGMAMWNPGYLSDIGFQLSVAATVGVLYASGNTTLSGPPPKLGGGGGGGIRIVRDIFFQDFRTSLAAQIATLPLILHHFGNLSVVAPLVNPIVLWVISPVMQVLALSMVVPIGGQLVALIAWPGLRWMTWVVETVSRWSWVSLEFEPMGWGWVAGYYLFLLVCIKFWFWRR